VIRSRAATLLWLAGVSVVAAILSYRADSIWDYPDDAGPPIDDLINGRFSEFISERPAMGPVSLLVRAPFAALSQLTGGGGPDQLYNDAYRFGIFPCLLAAGIVGLLLAREMAARGQPLLFQIAVGALSVVNPVSLRALHFGHPEEILTAAFAVGAVMAGLKGKAWTAALLLTLAVFSKQWAVVVVVPVALTLTAPALRRTAVVLVGLGGLLTLPLLAANPATFVDSTRALLDLRAQFVLPPSIWWPFTDRIPGVDPPYHEIPQWVGVIAHPLIVILAVGIAIALGRRVREAPAERVFWLLALVLLLRSVLDPVNNGYYHTPFLLALTAAAAYSGDMRPLLLTVAVLTGLTVWELAPVTLSAIYLTWALPFVGYLVLRAGGFRTPALRVPVAAPRAPG